MHSPEPTNHTVHGSGRVVVLGLNHESAPLAVREGVAFSEEEVSAAFQQIGPESEAVECALVSTCNRTEVYLVSPHPEATLGVVTHVLNEMKHVDVMGQTEWTYRFFDSDAVHHLFRVACGLDSMLVGEAQIFSQIKQAYDRASEAGKVGFLLNRLFQAALHVGKRARTETDIGAGAVSVSSAAVGLAEKVFGDLSNRTALLIGAGETARLAAEHLVEHGIAHVIISNRTPERGEALARNVRGVTLPFEQRLRAIPDADIVISATSAPGVLLTQSDIEPIMRHRSRRPLLMIDLAVPRDIDPSINELDTIFLYDIDALTVMVEQNLARRRKEIPKVEAIIRKELGEFLAWYDSLAVTPLIKVLREHLEAIRQEQLRRYEHQFTEEDRTRLDQFTRTLVNRILHQPLTQLRGFPQDARWGNMRLDTVRLLFGLEAEHETPDDPDRDAS